MSTFTVNEVTYRVAKRNDTHVYGVKLNADGTARRGRPSKFLVTDVTFAPEVPAETPVETPAEVPAETQLEMPVL